MFLRRVGGQALPRRSLPATPTKRTSSLLSTHPRPCWGPFITADKRYTTVKYRYFHTTPPAHSALAGLASLKYGLVSLIRSSLLILPFWWRYKLFDKYPKTSKVVLQMPILATCIVLALGIDFAPRTGRVRLLLMGEEEEMAMSSQRFEDLARASTGRVLSGDHPSVQLVQRACERLTTVVDQEDDMNRSRPYPRDNIRVLNRIDKFLASSGITPSGSTEPPQRRTKWRHRPWQIFVIDRPEVNALVLPSKEIFIYTGMIDALGRDEDMMACILGHEIAHVIQRHTVENMGFSAAVSVVFDVLRGLAWAVTIPFPVVTDMATGVLNFLNDIVATRAYSRKLESEADLVGLELMLKAGYDPEKAVEVWVRMEEVDRMEQEMRLRRRALHQDLWSNMFPYELPFLRTHPTTESRIVAIKEHLQQMQGGKIEPSAA